MADLKALQNAIHVNARAHGFWDGADNENIPSKLMLIVSELGEALEEFRHDRMDLYFVRQHHMRKPGEQYDSFTDKPEGFGIELADALIRILDLSSYLGFDMGALVDLKMEYNRGRPHMHGGRRV